MTRMFAALIRHGDYFQLADTPSAHQPFPLTEKGFVQANDLVPQLKEQCYKLNCQLSPVIASSKLLRAWQTAMKIVTGLNDDFTIEQHTDLAERSVGSVANLTIQQITELVDQDPRFEALEANWKSNSHFCLPFQGSESLMDAGTRVADFLTTEMQQLKQQNANSQLKVFVGHGAAFRHAAYHLGLLDYEQIAQLSMFHCQPIFIEYTADENWKHVAGNWKIRSEHSKFTD